MTAHRAITGNPYSKEELRAMLPKVGDRLKRVPTYLKLVYGPKRENTPPQPCTVIFVNPDKMWYTVRFDSGQRESYKVPDVASNKGGWGQ